MFGKSNGDRAVARWTPSPDPLTAYNLHHQNPNSFKLSRSYLENAQELQELADVGENVEEYLERTGSTPSMYFSPAYDFCINSGSGMDRHISTTSSSFGDMLGIPSPLTPPSDSLTMASTLESDMSRQSSFVGGFDMMRFGSSVSDSKSPRFIPHSNATLSFARSSNEEQSLWLAGTGGASHMLQSYPSSVHSETIGSLELSSIDKMKRSSSQTSNMSRGSESQSSDSSRSKQQLQRQIQLAARPIRPKQEEDMGLSRHLSMSSSTGTQSSDFGQDRAVTAIPKMPYQRPKHERVYCNKCEDHPDGFRGEHELRRHQDRQHKLVVTKYICVEPAALSPDDPRPVTPLSKCKACHSQKKKYGAYYNAAAHLRRAHFRPKPKSRAKGSKLDEKSQKRGGKGGGDWPTMPQLKRWMREVNEYVADNQTASIVDDEDGSEDGEIDIILPKETTTTASNNFASNLYFNDVSIQKSTFGQTDAGMQYMQLNMQQQSSKRVMRHEPSSSFNDTCMFVDVSAPYFNPSFEASFGAQLQDLDLEHLSNNNFM